MDPQDVEATRQKYYEDLEAGRVRPPERDWSKPAYVSPPTPGQKLRQYKERQLAQFRAEGGIIRGDEANIDNGKEGRTARPPAGTVFKGALIEEEEQALSNDPNIIDPDESRQLQGPGGKLSDDPTNLPLEPGEPEQGPDTTGAGDVDPAGSGAIIPENFEDPAFPFQDLRTLARKFSKENVTNRESAVKVLREELARRNTGA